jgi:hypothetical protein
LRYKIQSQITKQSHSFIDNVADHHKLHHTPKQHFNQYTTTQTDGILLHDYDVDPHFVHNTNPTKNDNDNLIFHANKAKRCHDDHVMKNSSSIEFITSQTKCNFNFPIFYHTVQSSLSTKIFEETINLSFCVKSLFLCFLKIWVFQKHVLLKNVISIIFAKIIFFYLKKDIILSPISPNFNQQTTQTDIL